MQLLCLFSLYCSALQCDLDTSTKLVMCCETSSQQINDKATRGARIKLDIEADSPILLIPESSRTDHVLVADLGRLRLTNQFIVDGQKGTLKFEHKHVSGAGRDFGQSRSRQTSGGAKSMHDMTESVFERYYPPCSRDPMTSSVYGSLDEDARCDGLEVVSGFLASESDTVFSPERGSSVDSSATRQSLTTPGVSSDRLLTSSNHSSERSATTAGDRTGKEEVEVCNHHCLLDVMEICLSDIDLVTAKRVAKSDYQGNDQATDMEFTSCVVQIEVSCIWNEGRSVALGM